VRREWLALRGGRSNGGSVWIRRRRRICRLWRAMPRGRVRRGGGGGSGGICGDGFVAAGDDESVAGEAVVVECVEGSDGGFVAAADG
jgi:hypothetical protein